MNYGYARVSTDNQNENRQLDELSKFVARDAIFVDKQSGKDFERDQWRQLLIRLSKGDTLFVKSIDRLGRNYREVLEQWRILTKVKEVDVVVLDMPLIDTRTEKNLLGTFIADLVLQILAFVAENERAFILKRQREGIDAAKRRGVVFGRPKCELPGNFDEIAEQVRVGCLNKKEAAKLLGLPVTTFKRRFNEQGRINGQQD